MEQETDVVQEPEVTVVSPDEAKDWPKGAKYRVKFETGRVLYCREPKFSDMRNAAQMASDGVGGIQALAYLTAQIQSQVLALHRNNGEPVDITNRAALFDNILDYSEARQLVEYPQLIGHSMKKKPPQVQTF